MTWKSKDGEKPEDTINQIDVLLNGVFRKDRLIDIITNFILVWSLNKISVGVLFIIVTWMTVQFVKFMKDPTKFKIVTKVEQYTYVQESIMLLTVACYLMIGAI